ncbi:MAG: hypothetical protein LH606_05370 [Cytophagaceae bacterium]|nr:hypothetical protein [Cytophagaceae bacterium]
MFEKRRYVEYLLSTPLNYTCTNLADHLEGVSHDVINDFLNRSRFTPRHLWDLVSFHIQDDRDSFLVVDDSVQTKRYSRFIELVKRQYSAGPPVRQ